MRVKNTKGKLKKGDATLTSVGGRASPPPKIPPTAPYSIFLNSIQRAKNLLKICDLDIPKDLKYDSCRASIVLAVSALDAFVRTFVIEKILDRVRDQKKPVPTKLREKIKEYLGADGLFDGAHLGDLATRIENAFRQQFELQSFQGIRSISEALKLIGHENVFHTIAATASKNEDTLKSHLGRYTDRRHLIAHCGDYDLNQSTPVENKIKKTDAKDCIKIAELVAHEINKLK